MPTLIARKPVKRDSLSQTVSTSLIETAFADLERSSRAVLVEQWRSLYRSDPPKGLGRRLLTSAIAYEMQLRQSGQSGATLRRRLERYEAFAAGAQRAPQTTRTLKTGARLVREWNGSTHVVDVGDDGYLWNGTRYRSLSSVARAITGASWSGPRFFGLTREKGQ